MSQYESRAALRAKIDWEGGLESFLHYGFSADDVPEGDVELAQVAIHLLTLWRSFQRVADRFLALLPEEEEGAW